MEFLLTLVGGKALKHFIPAAVAAAALAGSAHAAITVDGALDAQYGAPTSSVAFNAAAPTSNFGSPTNETNNVAYSIYLNDSDGFLHGFLQAAGATGGLDFANLYFDLDPANNNGSDLGFEVTNDRAFIPGVSGYSAPLGLQFAFGTNSLEFAIANSYFTGPIGGLSYYPGQEFPGAGDPVTLRLSQSFGFSVAGGDAYGDNRLGSVTIGGAVPEPESWAMMILGFLGVGSVLRARRRRPVFG